jgi:hypothetical protein
MIGNLSVAKKRRKLPESPDPRNMVFTPKGWHNIAQGKECSDAALGRTDTEGKP